jgi:two-component system, chemotaxis family, chemotaxis protein CheY
MRILLVDDDSDLREALAELLIDEGFEVTEASNGRDALELLEEQTADLIILDYMMPVMSGPEFRAQQLARPAFASIPVVLLSAAKDCADFKTMAPDVIMKKPFKLPVLLRSIRDLLPA